MFKTYIIARVYVCVQSGSKQVEGCLRFYSEVVMLFVLGFDLVDRFNKDMFTNTVTLSR